MKYTYNILDVSFSSLGVYLGVHNINEALGLILLIVSTINILYKLINSIIISIKTKNFKQLKRDLQQAQNDLEKIINKEDVNNDN